MTAKEAAKHTREAAKHSLALVKASPWAAVFLAIGAGAWAISKHLTQIPEWFSWSGMGTAAWGAFLIVFEHYSKRASENVGKAASQGARSAVSEEITAGMITLSSRVDRLCDHLGGMIDNLRSQNEGCDDLHSEHIAVTNSHAKALRDIEGVIQGRVQHDFQLRELHERKREAG